MDMSNVLGLPLLQPAQAQKHVTHNEALRILDALVQLTVVDHATGAPPSAPSASGTRYIVGPGASGDWAGHEGDVALFENGQWQFFAAQSGWVALSQANMALIAYNGSTWGPTALAPEALHNLAGIGVNATPDPTNRLAVSAPATLLNHEGGDHRLTVNKAGSGDTSSLVFQSGYSGRAEMGLAGSDGFSVRTSADGSAWQTALEIDPALARPTLPQGAVINGGLRGSAILGTVGPAGQGALMEQGDTANGRYVRYTDGTQICTATVDLTFDTTSRLRFDWTFPVGFAENTPVAVSFSILDEFDATPNPQDFAFCGARHGVTGGHLESSLRIYRRSGGANFDPADLITAHVSAVGRCF